MEQKLIAPQSPWQNPLVERLIGSIRRECLDQVIVLHQRHLHRILTDYMAYYHNDRTHRCLWTKIARNRDRWKPQSRAEQGKIVELPLVGGLHHRYAREAA